LLWIFAHIHSTPIFYSGCQEMIADSRADLECARLLTLSCASAIDNLGANKARDQIALIKYSVPEFAFRVIDRALQVSFAIILEIRCERKF
jgi:alkylation response protein AidB-like acyl-CoA dehydrogenase